MLKMSQLTALAMIANVVMMSPVTIAHAQLTQPLFPPPISGEGHPLAQAWAHSAASALMFEHNLMGMTVAASIDGRLVFSYGYGLSGNGLMTQHTRSPIGSNSKAVVTGPTTVELVKSLGMDPQTSKIYGPDGLLGTQYDEDIWAVNARYGHIAGTAIGPGDVSHIWYRDGTMATGSTGDFTKNGAAVAYSLPEGKTPDDIVDLAIDSFGLVYAFYQDQTYSVGTPTEPGLLYSEDVYQYQVPGGQGGSTLVGVAFAKSDNDVYAWFEDGTVSSGTVEDFSAGNNISTYTTPVDFKFGQHGQLPIRRYAMVGVGIAENDRVYYWYGDNKRSSGTSRDLDKYRALQDVKVHGSPKKILHYAITLQHLLNHKSGFRGSGCDNCAKTMFGLADDELTYKHIHKHFLRKSPLANVPGGQSAYSNHNFGMMTLIVEALTWQSFADVADMYIADKGAQGKVIPRPNPLTDQDSITYTQAGNGWLSPYELDPVTQGLAAGGYSAAAEDVLLITNALMDEYTFDEMDAMGWVGNSGEELAHSGSGDSYRSRVLIYGDGATLNGVDVSGIHVVVNVNTTMAKAPLLTFARNLAEYLGTAGIPYDYDLWAEELGFEFGN